VNGSTAAGYDAIHVFATTFEATRVALSTAVPLARGSAARLILIVPRVISYARPAGESADSADSTDFMERRYRDLVRDIDYDAHVQLFMCRRVEDIVRQLLPTGATIVVGGRAGSWLPTEETRLVRRLTTLGHHVVFVPMPKKET
jgi:hypothetical protein